MDKNLKGHYVNDRRPCLRMILALATVFLVTRGVASQPLFDNSGFEEGTYLGWTVEGRAFDHGPRSGAVTPTSDVTGSLAGGLSKNFKTRPDLYQQTALTGNEGKAFANSFHPEGLDKVTGALTSQAFVIQNDYISCLVAGGPQPRAGALAINLLVSGRIVRQAVPRGVEFRPCCFDVRSLKGQNAQIRIYDEQVLHGGWIAVGGFAGQDKPSGTWVESDAKTIIQEVTDRRTFRLNKTYLMIPASGGFPGDAVKLMVDGRVVQEICMAVADETHADFWQFIDVGLWQGEIATLVMEGWTAVTHPLAGVFLDDRIRGVEHLYTEKYRPQFHYTPIQGWSNDVNGTVYYDGEYHLFFQYDPSRGGNIGRNMHWGHAVSRDLFHWEHLPIALGVDPDRGQNYSGSAVVDFKNVAGFQQGNEKTLIAFYTRRKPHRFLLHDYDVISSDQCMAFSTDRGRTWTHVDKPVVPGISLKNRDPKVFWHEASGKWVMVFFVRDGYSFYTSDNLTDWQYESHVSGFHECPDIFQLEVDGDAEKTKWLLVNGRGDYSIGHFDGRQFAMEARAQTAFGAFSATQTFNHTLDDGRRRIQMSWFHVSPPAMPFKQLMSLPVEMTLRTTSDGVRVFTNPVKEIAAIQKERRSYPGTDLSDGPLEITDMPWELIDLKMAFKLNGAKKLSVSVRGIDISYNAQTTILQIGKGRAKAPIELEHGQLKLRVLIDRCSIDLFANDGQLYLLDGAYPENTKPALACSADGGATTVKDIEFCQLASIWNTDKNQQIKQRN